MILIILFTLQLPLNSPCLVDAIDVASHIHIYPRLVRIVPCLGQLLMAVFLIIIIILILPLHVDTLLFLAVKTKQRIDLVAM